MEEYVDPDSLVHEKAWRQPDVGQSQTSELSPAAVSEKLVAGKRSLFTSKNRLSFKALAIRVIFLVVAFSCFTGYSQQLGDRLMGPVLEYNLQYLEKTLKNLAGSLFLISVPKGVMEVAQTVELEPGAATISIGSVKIGQILEPYMHIIDDIWDFLVFSTYLVIAQVAALKLINLISIKFFLGLGALFCTIQYKRNSLFGKIGLTLIFLFVMTYVFYPLTLGMAAQTYEQHQIETSIQLSENLGVLKEQARDIDLSIGHLKDSIKSIPEILGQGLRTAWDAAWGLVVGLMLMFVMLPLLTLGTMYLIGRKVILYLDMPEVAGKMDTAGRHILNKVGSRSRSALAISRG
jgi:hypothetical protein